MKIDVEPSGTLGASCLTRLAVLQAERDQRRIGLGVGFIKLGLWSLVAATVIFWH
jgi:hypothetical protein